MQIACSREVPLAVRFHALLRLCPAYQWCARRRESWYSEGIDGLRVRGSDARLMFQRECWYTFPKTPYFDSEAQNPSRLTPELSSSGASDLARPMANGQFEQKAYPASMHNKKLINAAPLAGSLCTRTRATTHARMRANLHALLGQVLTHGLLLVHGLLYLCPSNPVCTPIPGSLHLVCVTRTATCARWCRCRRWSRCAQSCTPGQAM